MARFTDGKPQINQVAQNTTTPLPVTCASCGFELPENAEKNVGYFVTRLQVKDLARDKVVTGVPSTFMKTHTHNGHEKPMGDSRSGYVLKDGYKFHRWVNWCCRCHANKSRLQNMHLKTNHMIPDGRITPAKNITEALNTLNKLRKFKK